MARPAHRRRVDKGFPQGISNGTANTFNAENYGRAFIPVSRGSTGVAELPCPTCGSNLSYLDQYRRYYCHRCLQYAPEGYGEQGAQTCPTCGGILSYVHQYGRMYCYRCNAYPPEKPAAEPTTTEPAAGASSVQTAESGPSVSPSPSTPTAAAPPPQGSAGAAGTALVAVPEPTTPQPSPAAAEPAKAEETEPVSVTAPTETPKEPEPAPTEPAPTEPAPPSKDMQILAASKPAAVRVKIFSLKKADLVDLCRIYRLDPSGAKEELQQRLLGYLHDLEVEEPEGGEAPSERTASPETSRPEAAAQTPAEATEEATAATAPVVYATAAGAAVVEETPAAAQAAPTAKPAPAPAAEAPRPGPRAEHPCPTCGRELTYIAQYGRYYCYSCQRYAPAGAKGKNACPTCGATMRWIDQHRRWWCDSCQRYASADLPPPGRTAPVAAAEAAASAPVARTVAVHRHGSPGGGAGLVGLGIALYVVYAFFGFLGTLLGFVPPAGITPEMLDALQFLAFVLVALGAIVGLYGVRGRD